MRKYAKIANFNLTGKLLVGHPEQVSQILRTVNCMQISSTNTEVPANIKTKKKGLKIINVTVHNRRV